MIYKKLGANQRTRVFDRQLPCNFIASLSHFTNLKTSSHRRLLNVGGAEKSQNCPELEVLFVLHSCKYVMREKDESGGRDKYKDK